MMNLAGRAIPESFRPFIRKRAARMKVRLRDQPEKSWLSAFFMPPARAALTCILAPPFAFK